ncbi:hypothetical protein J6590_080048 [Homalodisca vitripennis]|nr:hypothetical protein J6590_080048 [Homalodisca vitripennis]
MDGIELSIKLLYCNRHHCTTIERSTSLNLESTGPKTITVRGPFRKSGAGIFEEIQVFCPRCIILHLFSVHSVEARREKSVKTPSQNNLEHGTSTKK